MFENIWSWLENKYCVWKYGKTKQQLIEEYIAAVKLRNSWHRVWRAAYRDYAAVDHNLRWGDND